jgi:hypothetical protein
MVCSPAKRSETLPPPCDASRRPASTTPEGGQNTEDRMSGESSLRRRGIRARVRGPCPVDGLLAGLRARRTEPSTTSGRSCSPSAASRTAGCPPAPPVTVVATGPGTCSVHHQVRAVMPERDPHAGGRAGEYVRAASERSPPRRNCSTIRHCACTAVVGSLRCSVVAKACRCASSWTACRPPAGDRGHRSRPRPRDELASSACCALSACALSVTGTRRRE